jgi:hypothetical protein
MKREKIKERQMKSGKLRGEKNEIKRNKAEDSGKKQENK